VRRRRILAFLLDLLLCSVAADAAALLATAVVWFWIPVWRGALAWVWAAAAAGALAAFLLRDASGGRSRRWLALEAVRPDGTPPGAMNSIRRNLPLLVPIWNLFEVWPVLRDGAAVRPADRRTGIRIVSTN
jgi:RDD family